MEVFPLRACDTRYAFRSFRDSISNVHDVLVSQVHYVRVNGLKMNGHFGTPQELRLSKGCSLMTLDLDDYSWNCQLVDFATSSKILKDIQGQRSETKNGTNKIIDAMPRVAPTVSRVN